MLARLLAVMLLLLPGCTVRQQDLDAWRGVPVLALDTHSLFLTVPMVRTVTQNGIEIRNYVNKIGVSQCFNPAFGMGQASATGQTVVGYSQYTSFQTCSARLVGCDNIFYIRDGRIIEYRPEGRCFTDERVQPQPDWQRFQ